MTTQTEKVTEILDLPNGSRLTATRQIRPLRYELFCDGDPFAADEPTIRQWFEAGNARVWRTHVSKLDPSELVDIWLSLKEQLGRKP